MLLRQLKPAAFLLALLLSPILHCQSFSPKASISRPRGDRCHLVSPFDRCHNFERQYRQSSVVSVGAHPISLPLSGVALLRRLQNFGGGKVRIAALLVAALASFLVYRNRVKLFWPGSKGDPSFQEPLPPGSLGCPFVGFNLIGGSKKLGPEYAIREASKKAGDANVWKAYFMGRPVAIFSGADLVKEVNDMEFTLTGSRSLGAVKKLKKEGYKEKPRVFGRNNLMFEHDKERHSFLRRLVGAAMTPQALKGALPTIQKTASDVIDREVLQSSKSNSSVKMEDVCVDYTMDIVQNQLLGLQLQKEEVSVFRDKLKQWLKAMYSLVNILNIPWLVKRSSPYRAKQYIVSKLEEKVDSLLKDGPDTSTLSNMLFVIDEENGSAKLSREQVIENAQLLVLAGSETSAGTLSLAMLLLGLHPDKYNKLAQEQAQVVETHGAALTQSILDKECPYLDAVIKETLRMGPVTAGFPRTAKETMVIDGVQIPRNWAIMTTYRLTHQLDPVTRLPDDAHMDPYTGFDPERWFDPATTPSDWIPFGAGPRFCLGYHLSMMEMKVFLAMFARRVTSFDLVNCDRENKDTLRWNPSTIIPRPSDGVLVDSLEESARPKVDAL